MLKRSFLFNLVGVLFIGAVLLSSCSAPATSPVPATLAATPIPVNPVASSTVVPTNTPPPTATPVPVATDTTVPSATPALAVTSVATQAVETTTTVASLSSAQLVPNLNAYCRKGPGMLYDSITFLIKGNAYNLIGNDGLNSWWQVQAPGNVSCWVGAANVTTQGPVSQVAIVHAPVLPAMPGLFENSYVCNAPLKTLSVALNWSAVDNVTGYRIFRNGVKIEELQPSVTSYTDIAPLGSDFVYELEAFNSYGVAPHISTSVFACK